MSHAALRIVFPTLQQNTSILQVLPTWIETLGRKIDAAECEKAFGWAGHMTKISQLYSICINRENSINKDRYIYIYILNTIQVALS